MSFRTVARKRDGEEPACTQNPAEPALREAEDFASLSASEMTWAYGVTSPPAEPEKKMRTTFCARLGASPLVRISPEVHSCPELPFASLSRSRFCCSRPCRTTHKLRVGPYNPHGCRFTRNLAGNRLGSRKLQFNNETPSRANGVRRSRPPARTLVDTTTEATKDSRNPAASQREDRQRHHATTAAGYSGVPERTGGKSSHGARRAPCCSRPMR
jgi:hypothetical protein